MRSYTNLGYTFWNLKQIGIIVLIYFLLRGIDGMNILVHCWALFHRVLFCYSAFDLQINCLEVHDLVLCARYLLCPYCCCLMLCWSTAVNLVFAGALVAPLSQVLVEIQGSRQSFNTWCCCSPSPIMVHAQHASWDLTFSPTLQQCCLH